MQHFQIGDVVRHDFSLSQGTITEIRADTYAYFVRWDDQPERNDWYKPEVLLLVRGSVPPRGNPTVDLASLGNGAIGVSNSTQRLEDTQNHDEGDQTPILYT